MKYKIDTKFTYVPSGATWTILEIVDKKYRIESTNGNTIGHYTTKIINKLFKDGTLIDYVEKVKEVEEVEIEETGKSVEFNEKSWHSKLYKRAYYQKHFGGSPLPDNLCPYFWKVMFVLVTLPLSWMFVLGGLKESYFVKIGLGASTYFALGLATMLGCGFNMHFLHWWTDPYWIGYTLVGVVGFVLIIGGLLVASLGIDWAYHKCKDAYRGTSDREPSLVGSKVSSWYNKVCPKINWKK